VNQIEISEVGNGVVQDLTPDQGRLLEDSGVVTARPLPDGSGRWRIRSTGKVGAARIGDIDVYIAPKLKIARLLFVAGYAMRGVPWRPETVPLTEADGLVPVFAQVLWRQIEAAIRQGLLPGYVVREETSLVLRGRLRESAQLHTHHGLPLPLEVRYDDFTFDIPENRILRTAIEHMLAVPRVDAESQRMLRYLLASFAEVSSLAHAEPVPSWHPTALNARYHTALNLAELVLRSTSVEHGRGAVSANGFLLDMAKLFEDFVTVALREEIEGIYGGKVKGQNPGHLDKAGLVPLRPDIVWRLHGRPVAVADAKYKSEKPSGYPNADLYQLLAYCTVLGLRRGHLIYAKGNENPAHHIVRGSGIEIICHAIDLDAEPEALLTQISDLAKQIASAQSQAEPLAPSLESV